MYVSLSACRTEFLTGCTPVIFVDACHLKGLYGGQLFCAIVKNANDDIFPMSYTVCENKYTTSWLWFLDMLIDDVGTFDPCQ